MTPAVEGASPEPQPKREETAPQPTPRSKPAKAVKAAKPAKTAKAPKAAKTAKAAKATKPAKTPERPTPPKPATPAAPVAVPSPGGREEHRVVSHVNLLSVLKLSIAFYLATVLVWLVAFVSLWVIAEAAGIIDNLENFIADLLAYDEFNFLSFEMLRAITIIGLVWSALATTLTVTAAAFYNLFADLLGGVEITLTDEPADRD